MGKTTMARKTTGRWLPKAKITGSQGDWLVTVKIKGEKSERLPTAHFEFINGMDYFRADGEMAKREGKYKKWHDALLSKKKIVLTNDIWEGEPGTAGSAAKRAGYIGVFAISDIKITDNHQGHSFKLSALLAHC